VLKSSPVIELTEAETEYVVSVVKHIFKEHIVLQYEVKNTIPSTVLENVSVVATPAEEDELEEVFIIQAETLTGDEPGKVYVAFRKVNGEGSLPVSSISNILKFTTKEIDPTTNEPEEGGYEDEYEIAEFDLAGSDYVIPAFASNFNHLWEQVGASGDEASETLQLSGVKSIAGMLHLPWPSSPSACENANIDHRCNRAIGKDTLPATPRRHRRTRQPDNAYPQAFGQDGQRRTRGGQH
jgi:coatomer subunit gamma